MNTIRTAQALGYAGLIPFAILSLDPLVTQVFPAPVARLWLLGYGAVILSFLGGIVWGRVFDKPQAGVALIVSILTSLLGWASLLRLGPEGFAILAIGFLLALVYDMGADLPPWFRRLRIHLSIGAILAMILGALA